MKDLTWLDYLPATVWIVADPSTPKLKHVAIITEFDKEKKLVKAINGKTYPLAHVSGEVTGF